MSVSVSVSVSVCVCACNWINKLTSARTQTHPRRVLSESARSSRYGFHHHQTWLQNFVAIILMMMVMTMTDNIVMKTKIMIMIINDDYK